VLKQMPEEDIEGITMEIANMSKIDRETRDAVMEEFMLLGQAQQFMLEGGLDYAKKVLEETLGPQKATEIIKRMKEQVKVKPFSFVRGTDPNQIITLIRNEHPQTIALILSYLDSWGPKKQQKLSSA